MRFKREPFKCDIMSYLVWSSCWVVLFLSLCMKIMLRVSVMLDMLISVAILKRSSYIGQEYQLTPFVTESISRKSSGQNGYWLLSCTLMRCLDIPTDLNQCCSKLRYFAPQISIQRKNFGRQSLNKLIKGVLLKNEVDILVKKTRHFNQFSQTTFELINKMFFDS